MGTATAPATSSELRLGTPIKTLKAINTKRAAAFDRLDIHTVSDLIRHLPARYEQLSSESAIDDLPMDAVGCTRGMIVATRVVPRRGRSGKSRFEATVEDHSTRLTVVWFNQIYLQAKIHPGMTIRLQGKVTIYRSKPRIINPQWERLDDPDHTPARSARIRPVYSTTEDLPSYVIEQLVRDVFTQVVDQLTDPLPAEFVRANAMVPLADAFRMAHQPDDLQETQTARRRLAYNELLLLQLGIVLRRHHNQTALVAPALHWSSAIDKHIRDRFPFDLTKAQAGVIREITDDLQRDQPMNRLLQGDVGAGKTVVALYALLLATANRKQGALMAPTELLAEQHFLSISSMLAGSNVRIALLSAGQFSAASRQRTMLLKKIQQGKYDIIIGTQALLADAVKFHNLAVVVIDEQHRFGVLQRAALRTAVSSTTTNNTADENTPDQGESATAPEDHRQPSPHCLVMTATPIPRTLSLTVFGDLDVSTIQGLPPGRTPITTRVVDQNKAHEVYQLLAKKVAKGDQAYVVVPAIDAPDSHDQNARQADANQLKSVRAHAQLLVQKYLQHLPRRAVAAVHGRLKRRTREAIMDRFRSGEIRVLVATTVIEVGVDVPNATLMVVEHAERFGLAQLHQLRGRIGRGAHGRRSLCVFIAEPTTDDAAQRLDAIAATTDGFKIAEHDLAIRGIGEFFGTRQHGAPPLRVANIPEDMKLLQLARRDAQALVESDPTLTQESHRRLRQVLLQQYGDTLGLVDVG